MKTERLISIIMTLLERRMMSTTRLAEMFEVSQRTIYRDMEAINRAGVPIVAVPGPGGGVGIMESYKLEKRLFTQADIMALLMALGAVREPLADDDVINALAKIKGLLPGEELRELESRAGRIHIDFTPWTNRSLEAPNFGIIRSALNDYCVIGFSYTDRQGRASRREVEPYRLILKENQWYLEGFCLERQDFRLFKLPRMREVQLSGTTFTPRAYEPLNLNGRHWNEPDMLPVLLRLQPELKDEYAEIYGEDGMKQEPSGTWLVRTEVIPGPTSLRFLLSLGPGCECLAPAEMRTQMLCLLEKLAQQYEKNRECADFTCQP